MRLFTVKGLTNWEQILNLRRQGQGALSTHLFSGMQIVISTGRRGRYPSARGIKATDSLKVTQYCRPSARLLVYLGPPFALHLPVHLTNNLSLGINHSPLAWTAHWLYGDGIEITYHAVSDTSITPARKLESQMHPWSVFFCSPCPYRLVT